MPPLSVQNEAFAKVIKMVSNLKNAQPFLLPVDLAVYPDYIDLVADPICLQVCTVCPQLCACLN